MQSTPVTIRLFAVFVSGAITWSLLSGVYALAEHRTAGMPLAHAVPGDVVVRA